MKQEDVQNLKETFEALDLQKRGEISFKDMCDGMRKLGKFFETSDSEENKILAMTKNSYPTSNE